MAFLAACAGLVELLIDVRRGDRGQQLSGPHVIADVDVQAGDVAAGAGVDDRLLKRAGAAGEPHFGKRLGRRRGNDRDAAPALVDALRRLRQGRVHVQARPGTGGCGADGAEADDRE